MKKDVSKKVEQKIKEYFTKKENGHLQSDNKPIRTDSDKPQAN